MERDVFDTYERAPEDFWYAKTRNELVRHLIKKYHPKFKDVLDCGCGTGFNYPSFRDAKRVVSLDISDYALKICKKQCIPNLVKGDAQKMPFKNNTFDVVAAIELIEHLDDDRAALREFFRVLRPGGIVVLTTPAFGWLWSDDDVLAHHKRRYVRKDLIRKVRAAGFDLPFVSYRYFFLFLPTAIFFSVKNLWRKIFKGKPRNSLEDSPNNSVLASVMRAENALLTRGTKFPFGVGFVCLLRKPKIVS